jgi:predicted nucleic acid-binding protein
MITALDTSVLLDLLIDDPRFGETSEKALRMARSKGRLIVCEAVVAEIRPALGSAEDVSNFLDDIGIEYEPCTLEAATLAGTMYAACLKNRDKANRVLPDFLVAAHAMTLADALLARDRGYYRDYFKNLLVIDPLKP